MKVLFYFVLLNKAQTKNYTNQAESLPKTKEYEREKECFPTKSQNDKQCDMEKLNSISKKIKIKQDLNF
jgi:hypothetical protein